MNTEPETKPKSDVFNFRFEVSELQKIMKDRTYVVINAFISVEDYDGKKVPVLMVEAEGRGGSGLVASRVPGCPIPPCNG